MIATRRRKGDKKNVVHGTFIYLFFFEKLAICFFGGVQLKDLDGLEYWEEKENSKQMATKGIAFIFGSTLF